MREGEWFHDQRVPRGMWSVIRMDGRCFSRLTRYFSKPFDFSFRDAMTLTARDVLKEMGGAYAYVESDEISVLLRPDYDFCSREVEKIVSLSASVATAKFNVEIWNRNSFYPNAHFDSRIWIGANESAVIDYFRWRMSDSTRCALNGWCYWKLREDGLSERAATSALYGMGPDGKNELLFQRGINFNDLPAWQRRGTGLRYETYEKEGFNPKTQKFVKCVRRRIMTDDDLPMKDAYRDYLLEIMKTDDPKEG